MLLSDWCISIMSPNADKNYLRRMETAIQLGQPVLMENVEESLDAALEPVLLKQTFKSAGSLMIKLGDSSVEWSPHFKFYMTTKLRNPHYPPELCTKVRSTQFCALNVSIVCSLGESCAAATVPSR